MILYIFSWIKNVPKVNLTMSTRERVPTNIKFSMFFKISVIFYLQDLNIFMVIDYVAQK